MTNATRQLSETELEDLAAFREAQERDRHCVVMHDECPPSCGCWLTQGMDELRQFLGKARFAEIEELADQQDTAEQAADRGSW